jgi:hypothetical protein
LGKDTTAATTNGPDSLMVFYGGLFDGSSALVSRTLPNVDEWNIRHFINSIFGYFAMLCAALVTVEIVGVAGWYYCIDFYGGFSPILWRKHE